MSVMILFALHLKFGKYALCIQCPNFQSINQNEPHHDATGVVGQHLLLLATLVHRSSGENLLCSTAWNRSIRFRKYSNLHADCTN